MFAKTNRPQPWLRRPLTVAAPTAPASVLVSRPETGVIKFFNNPQADHNRPDHSLFASCYKGMIVFPDATLSEIISRESLIGVPLQVQLQCLANYSNNNSRFIASVAPDYDATNLAVPVPDILDKTFCLLIDGQNFLRSLRSLDPKASAVAIIRRVEKMFYLSPQAVRLFICPETSFDLQPQLTDIASGGLHNIEVVEYHQQNVTVNRYSQKTKSDVDPPIMAHIGALLHYSPISGLPAPEVLVLFCGDKDFKESLACWLGLMTDCSDYRHVGQHRHLVVVASQAAMSKELRELGNHLRARLIFLEDLLIPKSWFVY